MNDSWVFHDIECERFKVVSWREVLSIQTVPWHEDWTINSVSTLFHDKESERSKLFHDLKCERFKTVPWLKVWTVQSYFMRWTIKARLLSSTVCFFQPHDYCVKGTAKTSFVRCNHYFSNPIFSKSFVSSWIWSRSASFWTTLAIKYCSQKVYQILAGESIGAQKPRPRTML